MAVLAQQAHTPLRIDGHHGGAPGMAHDLERHAHSIGEHHGVDAHLDDAAFVDHFCFDGHCPSLPVGTSSARHPRTLCTAPDHASESSKATETLLAAVVGTLAGEAGGFAGNSRISACSGRQADLIIPRGS